MENSSVVPNNHANIIKNKYRYEAYWNEIDEQVTLKGTFFVINSNNKFSLKKLIKINCPRNIELIRGYPT